MNSKLTLTIDEEVLKEAKEFAKQQNCSLSDIVSNYLKHITSEQNDNEKDEEIQQIKP